MDMDTARQVLGYQLLREMEEGRERGGGREGGDGELDGVRTTYGIYKYTMLELLIASLTTLSNSASSKSYNKEGHTSQQRCTWRLAHCHSHARR